MITFPEVSSNFHFHQTGMSVNTKIGKIHMAHIAVHNKLGRIHLKKLELYEMNRSLVIASVCRRQTQRALPLNYRPMCSFLLDLWHFFCLETYDIIVICKPHCIQLTLTVICYKQLAHVLYQAFQLCGG